MRQCGTPEGGGGITILGENVGGRGGVALMVFWGTIRMHGHCTC